MGIGKEGTRGVGVPATFWLPKSNFTFQDRKEDAISEAEYGGIWGYGANGYVVSRYGEGDIEAELSANSFGLILLATLGTTTPAGPVDSAYTHTFTLQNDNAHDSLSIHVSDPNQDKHYELAMIDSLKIDVSLKDIVKFTATFLSKGSMTSSSTPAYVADYKFTHKYFTLKLASDTSGLNAATALSVLGFSITFEKNAELNQVLGTIQPEDIHNKRFNIKGEFTLKYTDETYKDLALAGTTRALRFDLTNTDNLIGAATCPQFRLDLSKVYLDGWEADRPLDDINVQKLTFVALYDLGNSNVINSCYLVNSVASY